MAKPIITLNGLKIVIMLGMLVITDGRDLPPTLLCPLFWPCLLR
jgi:hypothetical protein